MIEEPPSMSSSDFESGFEDDSSQMEDFGTEVGAEGFGTISFNEIESDDEPDSDLTDQNKTMQQHEHQQTNHFGGNFNHALQDAIDQNGDLANQMHPNSDVFNETSTNQPTTQLFQNKILFKQSGSNNHREQPNGTNVQFQQIGSGIRKRNSVEQFDQADIKSPKKSRGSVISSPSNHPTEHSTEPATDQNGEASDDNQNNFILKDYFPNYPKPIQPLNNSELKVYKVKHFVMPLNTFRFFRHETHFATLVRKSYEPSQMNQERNNQHSTNRNDLNMAPQNPTTVSLTPNKQKV